MTKLGLVKKIVSLVVIDSEEAQTTIINAVAEWGLLKSENFVELLVNGDLEKASKRATTAELQEIIDFIGYVNEVADSQDQLIEEAISLTKTELVQEIDLLRRSRGINRSEFRTIVMKALFPYYELTWTFKTHLFVDLYIGSTLTQKVAKRTRKPYLEAILEAMKATEPATPSKVEQVIEELVDRPKKTKSELYDAITKLLTVNGVKYIRDQSSDVVAEAWSVYSYTKEFAMKDYTREQLQAIYDNLVLELSTHCSEATQALNETVCPQEMQLQVNKLTRQGFQIAFREWVTANNALIFKHIENLPESIITAVKLSRGELSVHDLELGELAQIRIASQDELAQLNSTEGAN
ncbi:hypothetical protein CBR56_07675 [Bacillus thuringiensis]|uniref:hypothetical protein n=1 Tax=Bacillus tropicus TaxID=2026188 RepID=UPI000B431724|nr:hypothetical protein [Bacillus tropicus]MED3037250.1 hypothetical protein [Bacillus tropicus]OTX85117.1 hypothetical protein BK728_10845 [Bacillus thuringiensis serovar chanpaisis]PNK31473.1 hypothetical protein CBR56_07675 [Bacillus thuringiensis]